MNKKVLLLSSLLILLTSCEPTRSFYTHQVLGDYYEDKGYISPLNTSITLKMFDKDILDEASIGFDLTIKELSKEVDRYNNYDDINNLKVINDSFGQEIVISKELFELLELSIDLTKLTKGNFHMAMGSIIDLYEEQFNEENVCTIQPLPTEEEIELAISCIPSYTEIENYIVLNEKNSSVTLYPYNDKEFIISLGAIAKGYVMQKAYNYLLSYNHPFIFDAGTSTVAVSGDNPLRDKGNWNIGMSNPIIDYQELLLTIQVDRDAFISTSGNYQKYFLYEEDGKEKLMHHILDVKTGRCNNYYNAISVVSYDASLGLLDALSTALFNMESIDECLSLIDVIEEKYECNISFALTSEENNSLKLVVSKSFNDLITGSIANNIINKKTIDNY